MDQRHEMANFVEVSVQLSLCLVVRRICFEREWFSSSGDILVYVNDTNVLGYSHTDVVRIFQSLSINDIIRLTVCRGYPLVVNFDDPQIDVVSLNGVNNSASINNLPNGGYTEYQPEIQQQQQQQQPVSSRLYTIKIRKGDSGFGFTVADSPSGQRVKAIVDKHRCQDLCENDLLLSINGQDLAGKQHADVVEVLVKCSKEIETIFVIRRGKPHLFVRFAPSLIVDGKRRRNHWRTISIGGRGKGYLYLSSNRTLIPSVR